MSLPLQTVKPDDWLTVNRNFNKIKTSLLGEGASPVFKGITFTGLTASRLIWTDANKALVSKDLIDLVAGTTNRVTVVDDGDGSVTISGPQDIHTGASNFTVAGLTITNAVVMGSDFVVFQPDTDSTTFLQVLDADGGNPVLNVDTINGWVGFGTNTPNQKITIGGGNTEWISRDRETGGLGITGGTGFSDGAYFQITGNSETAGPGLGSAEFVIRNNTGANATQRSKFSLLSYNGSSWTPRLTLFGDTGELQIRGVMGSGAAGDELLLVGGNTDAVGNFGAYFQINGPTKTASPGLGSAEFVIRNETGANGDQRSKFALKSYDGSSTWTDRFIIHGDNGFVGFNESMPETAIELTSIVPYFTLHNSTHEDSDGGKESRLNFKGEQSGGEETTLARIEVSHDGTGDDQLAKMVLGVNTGSGVVGVVKIDRSANTKIGDAGVTNYAQFASDGELTLAGTARVIISQDLEPTLATRPVANPPAEGTEDSFATHDFGASTDESVFFHLELAHDYAAAGLIHIHFDFFVDTAPASAESVVWGVEYKKQSIGDNFDFGTGTTTAYTQTAVTTGTPANDKKTHQSSEVSLVTTGFVAGDYILLRLFRDADGTGGTDNFAGDARVIDYHIEYLSDGLGEAT